MLNGRTTMLIALAYALGISASAILLLLVVLILVKRVKTIRNPAVFKARVRLTRGEFPGVADKWTKGYGSWVTDVLAVHTGIALSITAILPTAHLERTRTAAPDEAKALGLSDQPVIAALVLTTGATIDLAMDASKVAVGLQPYADETAQSQPAVAVPAEVGRPQAASAAGGAISDH
jgi:hypothetical protein